MLIVVLESKTFIFDFISLKLIEQIETGQNQLGLCGLATNDKAVSKTIALPGKAKGAIIVLNYGKYHKRALQVYSCWQEFKPGDSSARLGARMPDSFSTWYNNRICIGKRDGYQDLERW